MTQQGQREKADTEINSTSPHPASWGHFLNTSPRGQTSSRGKSYWVESLRPPKWPRLQGRNHQQETQVYVKVPLGTTKNPLNFHQAPKSHSRATGQENQHKQRPRAERLVVCGRHPGARWISTTDAEPKERGTGVRATAPGSSRQSGPHRLQLTSTVARSSAGIT